MCPQQCVLVYQGLKGISNWKAPFWVKHETDFIQRVFSFDNILVPVYFRVQSLNAFIATKELAKITAASPMFC